MMETWAPEDMERGFFVHVHKNSTEHRYNLRFKQHAGDRVGLDVATFNPHVVYRYPNANTWPETIARLLNEEFLKEEN